MILCVLMLFLYVLSGAALSWMGEILLLKPIKIMLHSIVLSQLVASDISTLMHTLRTRGKLILTRSFGLIRTHDANIQHFNSACRAARSFPQLQIARLLMSLNDYDFPSLMLLPAPATSEPHQPRHYFPSLLVQLQALAEAIMIVCLMFVCHMPGDMQDMVVDIIGTTCVCVLLILLAYSARVSISIPIVVAVVVVAMFVAGIWFVKQTSSADGLDGNNQNTARNERTYKRSVRVMPLGAGMGDDIDNYTEDQYNLDSKVYNAQATQQMSLKSMRKSWKPNIETVLERAMSDSSSARDYSNTARSGLYGAGASAADRSGGSNDGESGKRSGRGRAFSGDNSDLLLPLYERSQPDDADTDASAITATGVGFIASDVAQGRDQGGNADDNSNKSSSHQAAEASVAEATSPTSPSLTSAGSFSLAKKLEARSLSKGGHTMSHTDLHAILADGASPDGASGKRLVAPATLAPVRVPSLTRFGGPDSPGGGGECGTNPLSTLANANSNANGATGAASTSYVNLNNFSFSGSFNNANARPKSREEELQISQLVDAMILDDDDNLDPNDPANRRRDIQEEHSVTTTIQTTTGAVVTGVVAASGRQSLLEDEMLVWEEEEGDPVKMVLI